MFYTVEMATFYIIWRALILLTPEQCEKKFQWLVSL